MANYPVYTNGKERGTMETIAHPYCRLALEAEEDNVHKIYHDQSYGFPLQDDDALFGRLILEINQAGLSWEIILKKAPHFEEAYAGFSIAAVAGFGPEEVEQLMSNPGIIKNRRKIEAAVHNARVVLEIQKNFGSFYQWLLAHQAYDKTQWVKLFKQHLKFTGHEIVNEFLMSIGFLPGAHDANCPVYAKIDALKPPMRQKG